MTRNADRAIGRLDVMPGGHSALIRAHQDIADPLFNAFSGAAGAASVANYEAYSQQTEGPVNSVALPNPWGGPAQTTAAATPAIAPSVSNASSIGTLARAGAEAPAAGVAPSSMGNMMQQLLNNPSTMQQGLAPAASGSDPVANTMQQMMSNPAMLQQSMAMAQQMFGGGQGSAAPALAGTTPSAPASDPTASMMQQMMSNPAMMQQSMTMAQQMFGGGQGHGMAPSMPTVVPSSDPMANMMQMLGGGGFGGAMPFAAGPPAASPAAPAGQVAPMDIAVQRVRFAGQLSQLMAMGFSDEAVCLQALARHNGRVDSALDALLSGSP